MMEGDVSPIDRYVVTLTGKVRPKLCVLPTPTGDAESVIANFYAAFHPMADVSQLTPFRKAGDRSLPLSDVVSGLLSQDAIFVTGGNTKAALAVWRDWGIDEALRAAYDAGVLISGMSAGAACWFQRAFSDSFGDGFRPLPALGWLTGGFCPHFNGEDGLRATALEAAVARGEMIDTLAVDDFAAVLFEDGTPQLIVNWREHAGAYRVQNIGSNGAIVAALETARIDLRAFA